MARATERPGWSPRAPACTLVIGAPLEAASHRKAASKGLVLPSDLHIYKVLAQEAKTVKESVVGTKLTRVKPATTVAGIGGYYGGPSRMNSQETQKLPAHVEARLMILRTKQRAAAHDMRDRGKSKAARDAAELEWARARQEAEKLERQAACSTPLHPLHPGRT